MSHCLYDCLRVHRSIDDCMLSKHMSHSCPKEIWSQRYGVSDSRAPTDWLSIQPISCGQVDGQRIQLMTDVHLCSVVGSQSNGKRSLPFLEVSKTYVSIGIGDIGPVLTWDLIACIKFFLNIKPHNIQEISLLGGLYEKRRGRHSK